ncbi:4-carboxy-4-hydroxy-2-oxoadipate aldolase/oxaloacetate decarboxylase [Egicoccus halophilus]|uniref:Putative 4-hydroxy-4-methyl-2-oxoglutarate aldolase n=1 Tax=Egicoccus halophilus TaxID=1670830 RepID=A0A8J3EUN9_9ACTN|nr:4-carboxy-4-hydroxy-2-oxoadipate aldolase/oxaloacetate decarboxylase [Egicoccus halophilus]GGI07570.1 4-carboxy-4-hydroxy-2-oxoadipate aldolase/oxaloacetate decarboxylase [Egicoccus halophilus]
MLAVHGIVRNIERADAAHIRALAGAGVATVHETTRRRGPLRPSIRPARAGSSVADSAVTVSCQAGDHFMIHAAVEGVREGDMVVMGTTSRSTDGMFGELLATSSRAAGCAGVYPDADVRDVSELNAMGFPVWCRAVHTQGTVKATPGSVNVPVVLAGMLVRPGDVVVADDDDGVGVPRDGTEQIADASRQRLQREEATRERLANAELDLDIYGLRERLADVGVVHQDHGGDA